MQQYGYTTRQCTEHTKSVPEAAGISPPPCSHYLFHHRNSTVYFTNCHRIFTMRVLTSLLVLFHVLALTAASQGDKYAADPHIYELTPSNFDKVVQKTNYTSIVKFYAPWCGYCQKLEPAFHKLGKLIQGTSKYAINVATVNCDKDYNKPLCAQYKVTGFPTILVFRPPKYDASNPSKVYKHAVETYNGERGLHSMHAFLTSRIKNYVRKFANLNAVALKEFFDGDEGYSKVVLVTESQQISPLYKSLAIDFITTIKFGMVSLKTVEGVKSPKVLVAGEEVDFPILENDKLPLLVNYNAKTKKFTRYGKSEKLSDKLKLSEWLVEENDVRPLEGELLRKDVKYYSKYRGAKKLVNDEL